MRDQDVRRFALLASAIAGRVVEVAPAESGEAAWTDGVTIFVDAAAGAADQVRCITVQAALLGAGSLDADVVSGLGRRAAVARRYLAVEGHRALSAQGSLLPTATRALMDAAMASRSESVSASLAIATSREAVDDPPAAFGTIRPRDIRALADRTVDASVSEAKHIPRRENEESLRVLDDVEEDDEDDATPDAFSSPVGGGGGAIARLAKRMLRQTRSSATGSPGADAPTHWTARSARVSAGAAVTTGKPAPLQDTGDAASTGTRYPEWDVFGKRYRLDWCTVMETGLEKKTPAVVALPDSLGLRRPLARLGIGLERRHRQLQGDDIDIDAAVEARAEVMAGSAPDEAFYVDSVRRRRDLSVLVLLDVSGSSNEPSATGVPVHEHQRAAAAALTVALHDLGDRVALYAFRSQGRSAVHVMPVKRFDDHLDALVFQRLGGLVPGAYTRLGAAIRHGASVVERRGGTPSRLLVVLSDGFAYDHGYEGAYGEADARRALAEARRRGTGCLCLSIGAGTDAQALQRVFGTAAHAVIPRADQLAGVVGPLFRSALRSAEAQQRVWQRKERTRERFQVESGRRTA